MKSLKSTEAGEQSSFVEWFRLKYPKLMLFHIANGELRHNAVGKKLKKMGVLAGVHDLYLMDYQLFIEFKRDKKGKLSELQKTFDEKARSTGHKTMLVHGCADAMEKIVKFIAEAEPK